MYPYLFFKYRLHILIKQIQIRSTGPLPLVVRGIVGEIILLPDLARLFLLSRLQLGTGGDSVTQPAAVGTSRRT